MKRRSLLVSLSGIAGLTSLLSTGAFTSVTADRGVMVQVTGDASAFLSLRPSDGPNGAYAAIRNGQLEIQFNEQNSAVPGSGFSTNALTQILNVFVIENQGTEEVGVRIQTESINTEAFTFVVPQKEVAPSSDGTYPEPDVGSVYGLTRSEYKIGPGQIIEEIDIGPGESVEVGVRMDTRDNDPRDGDGTGGPSMPEPDDETIHGSITFQATRKLADDSEYSKSSEQLEAAADE